MTALPKLPITAIILTFNEELHLTRCLSRVIPWVEQVVVVDSFSSDRTVEIARAHGADVLQNPWKNYACQFQWALDHARIETPWVMRLDADEYWEDAAVAELRARLPVLPSDVTALRARLKVVFRGRPIRHGRHYSTWLTRIWRREAGSIEQRWMDEHIVLSHGRTLTLQNGDLVDHNLNDLGWWVDKHNRYATRHMVDFVSREHGLFVEDRRLETSREGRRKRFLKHGLYGRTPLYLRATLFFLYRYVARLGFLDGRQGFLFHFMHGFWLMMLIDAKIDEARRFIRAHGLDAFRLHLAEQHGIEP